MHPAIRKDYMFHNQYQPAQSTQVLQQQNLPQPKSEAPMYQPYNPPPFQTPKPPEQQFHTPKQAVMSTQQANAYSSPGHSPPTVSQQEQHYQAPTAPQLQYEMSAPKPVYPHQQYFQKQQPQQAQQPNDFALPLPQVMNEMMRQPQSQPQEKPFQQLPPLPQMATPLMQYPEPMAKIAECPPDMTNFVSNMIANIKRVAK